MPGAVDAALYTTLASGTALTTALGGTFIYHQYAPPTVNLPYVVFSLASGLEENMTPRDSERRVYLVKAVAASLGSALVLAEHIDALLHKQTLSISGYVNFWTSRDTLLQYLEYDPAGVVYGHAGGEYVIRVEQS